MIRHFRLIDHWKHTQLSGSSCIGNKLRFQAHLWIGKCCEEQTAQQRQRAGEDHVLAGDAALGIDGAKKRLRQRVPPAHAVKEPGGGQLRSHSRADIRHQQRQVDEAEQPVPANEASDIGEGGFEVREGLRCGPDKLRDINLERRQQSRDQAAWQGFSVYRRTRVRCKRFRL